MSLGDAYFWAKLVEAVVCTLVIAGICAVTLYIYNKEKDS